MSVRRGFFLRKGRQMITSGSAPVSVAAQAQGQTGGGLAVDLDLDKIPQEMKIRGNWVCFKHDKTPVNPRTGGNAMADDPETWGSFNDAVSYYEGHRNNGIKGIGYEFGIDGGPHTGIDLDKFRYEDGSFKLCAQFLIKNFASYAEISPSGTGVHILIHGRLPDVFKADGKTKTGYQKNLPCKPTVKQKDSDKIKIEFYDRGRYFSTTSNHIAWSPPSIEPRQNELNRLYQIFVKPKTTAPRTTTRPGTALDLADSDLLDKARSTDSGFPALYDRGDISAYGGDDSSADFALCCRLAFWTGHDYARIESLFNASALGQRSKWQDREDYRQRTINNAIDATPESYDPEHYKHSDVVIPQIPPADEPPPIEWLELDAGTDPPDDDADFLAAELGAIQAEGGHHASELSSERQINNDNKISCTLGVSSIDEKIRTSGIFSEAEISYLYELIKRNESHNGIRNFAAEIREWLMSSNGVFYSSDVDKELHLSSLSSNAQEKRNIQKHISKTLERLVDDGSIERYGNKRGCFRRIEKECVTLDFMSAPTETFNILWPFNLERLVTIYRKSIVIVAGAPNSGKTAYLLNTVRMNMNSMPTIYFSSEMGESELRGRLEDFGYPLTSWNFQAKERAANFHDAIDPDALNIIDYLEISDNFYQVAEQIRKIYDRLKTGIAVIALQKNAGADLGSGGRFSSEKARLYIAMDSTSEGNKLKIVKAKKWAQKGINPNGKEYGFKIVNGCKFTNISEI
jgi:hypothetical protein